MVKKRSSPTHQVHSVVISGAVKRNRGNRTTKHTTEIITAKQKHKQNKTISVQSLDLAPNCALVGCSRPFSFLPPELVLFFHILPHENKTQSIFPFRTPDVQKPKSLEFVCFCDGECQLNVRKAKTDGQPKAKSNVKKTTQAKVWG